MKPTEMTLTMQPSARFDVIDVRERVRQEFGDILEKYSRAFYCSFHTTAGYLEQSFCARLGYRPDRLAPFIRSVQKIFPPDAGYQHDQMDLRDELSEEQKRVEPRNADSHLTFISSGLRNCVTYTTQPGTPVFFMELDGVYEGHVRTRKTSVLAFNREVPVATGTLEVPVSRHQVNAVNLLDPDVGLLEGVDGLLKEHPIGKGRVEIDLDVSEEDAALTVNEYETLLMKHDLKEVLQDPIRFMAQKGRHMLQDPRAIPGKSRDYAKYDAVRVLNEIIDALGLSESALERLVARLMGLPARKFLRLKRSISFPISNFGENTTGRMIRGTYQSPILLQWRHAPREARKLSITLKEFT